MNTGQHSMLWLRAVSLVVLVSVLYVGSFFGALSYTVRYDPPTYTAMFLGISNGALTELYRPLPSRVQSWLTRQWVHLDPKAQSPFVPFD